MIFFSIMMIKWLFLKNMHAHIKASVQKLYTIYGLNDQNGQNGQNQLLKYDTLSMTKTAEYPYPLGLHILT